MLVHELFNPDDLAELRKNHIVVNRDTYNRLTRIRIKENTDNELLGKITKMILKNYCSRR